MNIERVICAYFFAAWELIHFILIIFGYSPLNTDQYLQETSLLIISFVLMIIFIVLALLINKGYKLALYLLLFLSSIETVILVPSILNFIPFIINYGKNNAFYIFFATCRVAVFAQLITLD